MTGELNGKVAVVTGGGRGVGRAIVHAVAAAGASVAVVARTEGEVGRTAAAVEQAGGHAVGITADVTSERELASALDRIGSGLGPVDVLVNNAGTCNALGPVWEVDPEVWWRDVEVNLRGTFLFTRAVLPGMLDRGRGCIVNVSSYAATRPDPYRSAYSSAKIAVLRLADTLQAEIGDRGVSVFAITPGTVETEMTQQLEAVAAQHEWPVDWPKRKATKWCAPERAGELVVYLASGKADVLAGRFLHVLDDVPKMVEEAEAIRREDLYAVRLRRP